LPPYGWTVEKTILAGLELHQLSRGQTQSAGKHDKVQAGRLSARPEFIGGDFLAHDDRSMAGKPGGSTGLPAPKSRP